MWVPKFFRKKTKVKANYNWTPASTAMGDHLVIEPVNRSGRSIARSIATVDRSLDSFRSTAASQWSTAELRRPHRKQLASPIHFNRGSQGEIVGIRWSPTEVKEQLEHWKWLLGNPRLMLKVVSTAHESKQGVLDSALFL